MITVLLIVTTGLVSMFAFNNRELFNKLQFNAYAIKHHREWYRFISYGLIHADWIHLMINMFVLYSFGTVVEHFFKELFGLKGVLYYFLLYVGGITFSTLSDFGRHKDDSYYNAVGASGAVSAVVFSSIIFHPTGKIFLFMIPVGIPAAIFGILYLVYSAYMAKKSVDNIGHNAHFWGAVYGVALTILLKPVLIIIFISKLTQLFN